MAEFTEIGRHCAAENCNQQDFLPFTCDCCHGTFCLPHRSYVAHSCAASGDRDFRALICPLCKRTVRFAGSEDPNEQWDLHARSGCNPGDYTKNKPSKKRCSARTCRSVLGPTNTQRCARCTKETCLTHRFPDSHDCSAQGSAAAAAVGRMEAAKAMQSWPMSLREKAAPTRSAASSQNAASLNTARATADRRRRTTSNPATAALGRVFGGSGGGSGTGRAGSGQGGERCPQCGASFGDVESLVAHVEAFHSEEGRGLGQLSAIGSGGSGGVCSSRGERCPICSSHFADAALLVSHVEAAHPGGAASNCSIC